MTFSTSQPQLIEPSSERLHLRQWTNEDLPLFAHLNADTKVMRYFPSLLSSEQSNAMADKIRRLICERGWGFWALELKESGEFIGFTGLHTPSDKLPCSPCVEIGWRLASSHWGKGYATEAANTALSIAFEHLNFEEIVAFTAHQNQPSIRVMQRIGMHNTEQDFNHPEVPTQSPLRKHVLYKIGRAEWSALK